MVAYSWWVRFQSKAEPDPPSVVSKITRGLVVFGALGLAGGIALPFLAGTSIWPVVYDGLQLGGLGMILVGWALGVAWKRRSA